MPTMYKKIRMIWHKMFALETMAYINGANEELTEEIFKIRNDVFSLMTDALIDMSLDDLQEVKNEVESNSIDD